MGHTENLENHPKNPDPSPMERVFGSRPLPWRVPLS